MTQRHFNIHGDNIVECVRAFDYVVSGLGDLVLDVRGPSASVTCPVYSLKLQELELLFQFLPGYGDRRWNQDILSFVQQSGGRLREAADAIVTVIQGNNEKPVAAIEFCGALPAGNQAWQRHGRAFSYAHAGIPFFYVAELGGFELDSDRNRKAQRMPNPAVPFSFFAMTKYQGSVCLPVYEANAGATADTIGRFEPIFGKAELLKFLQLAVLRASTDEPAGRLSEKCIGLVKLLADAKGRKDGLSSKKWEAAYTAVAAGQNLPDYLSRSARLPWKKKISIKGVTATARKFMGLGAAYSLGLTSNSLPLSFVPKENRATFTKEAQRLYVDMSSKFATWLANGDQHLAIAWVNGFKPRGDDARPDRGLPPLARMLVGNDCELLTFVYGPAPTSHWDDLATKPMELSGRNGLWEAILGVSDGVLVDSSTKPKATPRGYLRSAWAVVQTKKDIALRVYPKVRQFGEQDVDTTLHAAFGSLGPDIVFEGMCNPPGGDWSGISFCWDKAEPEHRWLTLPRVSAHGAKRPDHVFALFGHGPHPVCLCIESKEHARALDMDIGLRLTRYTEALFDSAPSIHRSRRMEPWAIYELAWDRRDVTFLSAGAYLSTGVRPFAGVPASTGLDIQVGVELLDEGRRCILHLRGDTAIGRNFASYLGGLTWGNFVCVAVNN